MPKRRCIIGYGCSDGGIAVPGTSRCRNHPYRSNWAKYKAPHSAAYKTREWQERRDRQLRENPNCAWCGRPATDADHVTSVALGGSFDGPLQSLCGECHRRKTGSEGRQGRRRKR